MVSNYACLATTGAVSSPLIIHVEAPSLNLDTIKVTRAKIVTGLVDTLCGQGLLERVDHGGDRRVVCVRLTATGRETFEVMAAAHAEWIAGMMQDLSDADIADLMRLLGKMKLSVRGMIDEYIE